MGADTGLGEGEGAERILVEPVFAHSNTIWDPCEWLSKLGSLFGYPKY